MLLLDESSDFTELELLESEETFVSFVELLDLVSLLDDLSLVSLPEDFLSIEEDDSSKSEVSTDELEVPVSSELADDESSHAENASIAKATALTKPSFFIVFIIHSPVIKLLCCPCHPHTNHRRGLNNGFGLFNAVRQHDVARCAIHHQGAGKTANQEQETHRRYLAIPEI
ncbi:hypothetical protein [Hallerella succinigenes]|uniref:hypothetical protein n=1 Tax=Hallerella succinigenes TaxID=1896222 RepID=UPI0012FD9334|nr:hypothetical protein [Hallerella succinigenes]